jgi:hypothetical protein
MLGRDAEHGGEALPDLRPQVEELVDHRRVHAAFDQCSLLFA